MKKIVSILTAASLCATMLFSIPVSAEDDVLNVVFDTSNIGVAVKAEGDYIVGSFAIKIAYDPEYVKSLNITENSSGAYRLASAEQYEDYYIVSGTRTDTVLSEETAALFDITGCEVNMNDDGQYTIRVEAFDDENSGFYDENGDEIPIKNINYNTYDLLSNPKFINPYIEQEILVPPDIEVFETMEGISINITCATANADIYYIMESTDDNDYEWSDDIGEDNEEDYFAEEDYDEEYNYEGTHGEQIAASQEEIDNIVNNGRKYTGTIKLTRSFNGTIKAVSCTNESFYSEYIATADIYVEKLNDPIVTYSVEDGRIFVSMSEEYEDAEIYYTTDGTTPNLTSRKFTNDLIFNIKSIPEIAARAYLNGYVCSDVVYRKYTSDPAVSEDGRLPAPTILWSRIGSTDSAIMSINGYYGAELYYYMIRHDENGEESVGSPRLYSEAIQVEEGTTICAYAIKTGYLKSDITTETIDFTEPEYPFTTSEWAREEVVSAYNTGLLPYELEDADLTEDISREKFAAIAVTLYERLSGEEAYGDIDNTPFIDCNDSDYASYIAAAYELGITDGINDDNTEFGPNRILNREQLVTMLCRVIKKCYLTDWTLDDDSKYELDISEVGKYPDDYLISDYAKPSVYYMAKYGVIDSDGCFNPTEEQDGIATIEQAVLMALRTYNVGERFDPDYTERIIKHDEEDTTISNTAIAGGSCGENVVWEIDEYGVMTIKGKGKMNDRATVNVNAPWADYVKDITAVVVKKGVTSIGDYAFANMSNMKRIIFPSGLKRIGIHAFYKCTGLEIIEIKRGVETIEKYAFSGCVSLKRISVPNGLNRIETGLFEGCTSLEEIDITGTVKTIGSLAFSKCTNLESIYIPTSVISIETNAFAGCSNLTEIDYGGSRNEWTAIIYSGSANIPSNVVVNCAK